MADYNVSAVNGFFNPYNSYMNQVGLSNMYDSDSYFSSPFGMGGSIWNANPAMPFAPTFGGMNYDAYYNHMTDYLNFTSNYNLQMVENQRRNDLRINATDEAIQGTAAVLNEKIVANEQDQVQDAYIKYIEAVAAKYPGESPENIIARAKTTYRQIYNTSVQDDLRKYGRDSYTHGLFKSLTLGLYHKNTAEDNIATLNNQPVSRWEKTKEVAGLATGGAAVTGAGVFAAKHLGWLTKIPKAGWIIGGIVAAGSALAAIFGTKK